MVYTGRHYTCGLDNPIALGTFIHNHDRRQLVKGLAGVIAHAGLKLKV